MTIGERIRSIRKSRNLTQKQLGELTGIAEPTIRRYELGKLNPKYETIEKIADKLGTTPAFLMGLEEPYTANELIDIYIHGAKKWAADFRFSEQQKVRLNEFLAESALRLKDLMNKMADADRADGRILMTPEIQNALDGMAAWTANALEYVNQDYSENPKV